MDQPRLKLGDEEIGLRKIGDNLFEPKNTAILLKVANNREYRDIITPTQFFEPHPMPVTEPKTYRKIESFCFVATDNIKEEAELLLKSLRQFHDQPVYLICDKGTRIHLAREDLLDNVTVRIQANDEQLDKINKKIFKGSHKCIANNIHSPACILKKMDVMDLALQEHNNTFFLDSDIIVLDNLQEHFLAEVVLSPHYYPDSKQYKGFEFGFYNAGYVFCANRGFPKFWRHMYLNESTFFEQECMNRISEHYTIQTFGREHNVGFWREQDLPEKAKSIHAHITTGVDKNRSKSIIDLNTKIKDYAISQAEKYQPKISSSIKTYYNPHAPKKLAFIHFGKCAGVYVQHYIRNIVTPNIKHYNSWWDLGAKAKRMLDRDWTKKELLEIATTDTETGLAHNHQINWCKETVKAFNDNGWLTFMFIRDPKEILCSLYFWSQRQHRRWKPEQLYEELRGPLREEIKRMSGQADPEKVTLDDFIKFLITDEEAQHLWILPDYINEIEHVAEFNDKNFGDFLLKYFGHDYVPQEKRNTSPSKGYEFYRKAGEISEDTHQLLTTHPEAIKYNNYLSIGYSYKLDHGPNYILPSATYGKCSLCLEIGCWEGTTSMHIVNKALGVDGKLICVDPLTDQYLNSNLTPRDEINNKGRWKYFKGQYDSFMKKTKGAREVNKLELIRKKSEDAYSELLKTYKGKVDFIYVDGDHREESVYLDAINCFRLCKIGGYITFDDYNNWGGGCCRRGINRFLEERKGLYIQTNKSVRQITIKKVNEI